MAKKRRIFWGLSTTS